MLIKVNNVTGFIYSTTSYTLWKYDLSFSSMTETKKFHCITNQGKVIELIVDGANDWKSFLPLKSKLGGLNEMLNNGFIC